MSGLSFSLGGKLDPSYEASLKRAESEARAASLRIQNSLRSQISGLDSAIAKMSGASPEEYLSAASKRAGLQRNLLIMQNAQYVAAARERMAVINAEKSAEESRYSATLEQSRQVENLRANLDAENAAMLRNRDALRALIAERKSAAAELARYNSSSSQSGGFYNPRAGDAEDNARMLRFSSALKASIAASNAKAALIRYNQASGVSVLELSKNVDSAAGAFSKAAHGAGGLNLIIRETLVIFREIGRGNWTRIPGSLSLIAQGFSTLKGVSMAMLGAWGLAIGGLIGSVFIYFHRVKALAKSLQESLVSAFNPEHIARYLQKANIIPRLNQEIADSVRNIREEHDGVEESLRRQLDLTQDKIAFEREMLETQKANALAAVRNPAEREAIEKKYSALILANKKKERDAEVKSMQDEVRQLPKEIEKSNDEIKKLTGADSGYISESQERQILKEKQDASDKYDDYRKQLMPGEKDKRDFSADKDRETVDRLKFRIQYFEKSKYGLDPTLASDRAQLNAAQARLSESARTQKDLNDFIDAGGDREMARKRVDELRQRIKDAQDRLAKLGPQGGGLIEDTIKRNMAKDQQDLALEQERLKRVNPGAPLHGREVTERERAGLGSPQVQILDVNKSMDRTLKVIAAHVTKQKPSSGTGPLGDPFTGF